MLRFLKIATAIVFGFSFLSVYSAFSQVDEGIDNRKKLSLTEASTISDSLRQYSKLSNILWSEKRSDLDFAIEFLSLVSRNKAEKYYRQTTTYYLWSLKKADFQTEEEAIEKELKQLLPLVSDSTKNRWDRYFKMQDRQLLNEMAGFWEIADPFAATRANERLIEHWQRINFAQSHFRRNESSPYHTDDRGTFYVRLGSPDRKLMKRLSLSLAHIRDPITAEGFSFGRGIVSNIERYDAIINPSVEIWEYRFNNTKNNVVYLFGQENSYGEYGLRKTVLELINTDDIYVSNRTTFRDSYKIKKASKNIIQLGLYQQLARYDFPPEDIYQEIYQDISNNFSFFADNPSAQNSNIIDRYANSPLNIEGIALQKFHEQVERTPATRTSQLSENEKIRARTNVFRFLNREGENEFVLVVKPMAERMYSATDTVFLSNKIFVYNNNWDLITDLDDLKKIGTGSISSVSMYTISEFASENKVYFSSEVIDTTRNNTQLPRRVNSKTSAVIAATGKKKLTFPKPLPSTGHLQISDIVIGRNQIDNIQNRVPVNPSMDLRFKQGSDINVFFEVYNIPEDGYKFTYYFMKDRWLWGKKKIGDKPQVTILSDKINDRDMQLFSINLSDLKPDEYELVFEFTSQSNSLQEASLTKNIELTILE